MGLAVWRHVESSQTRDGKVSSALEGMTEDEMVGWHHRLNGHEFEQTLGDSEGQGSWHAAIPW